MFLKLNSKEKRLYGVLLFLVKFFLLSLVLHFLIWLNIDMTGIQNFVAQSIHLILTITGFSITKTGVFFILKDSTGTLFAEITRDCIAWKSILAYVCLIFATEVKAKKKKRKQKKTFFESLEGYKKVRAMLIGSAIIFFANIVRLVTTFAFVHIYGIKYFDFIHNILWQGGMMILIIALWDFMRRKYL
ncbi:MAG: exosortase/archaeosortase family protein [Candidatus Aenigmarchaeota archaeon]|nr:exosortase/archaeosortase family protein [Candidatus Aenigmarchaeota archaeon]